MQQKNRSVGVRAVVYLNEHLVRKERKGNEPGGREDGKHRRYGLDFLFVLNQPSAMKQKGAPARKEGRKDRRDGKCACVSVEQEEDQKQ